MASRAWRIAGVVAVYAVIGPIVGGVTALVWTLSTLDRHHPLMGLAIVMVWTLPLLAGMIMGFPPAVASGVVMAAVSTRVHGRWMWLAASAVLTAGLALASRFLFDQTPDVGLVALAGALAGLVCGLITLGFRPRT